MRRVALFEPAMPIALLAAILVLGGGLALDRAPVPELLGLLAASVLAAPSLGALRALDAVMRSAPPAPLDAAYEPESRTRRRAAVGWLGMVAFLALLGVAATLVYGIPVSAVVGVLGGMSLDLGAVSRLVVRRTRRLEDQDGRLVFQARPRLRELRLRDLRRRQLVAEMTAFYRSAPPPPVSEPPGDVRR